MTEPSLPKRRYHIIALLILAGEAVFLLPFIIPRIFRPTFLDVFQINNLELGTCFSIYGIVALISYFFGGLIADRFQPRKLMATALFMTALGGVAMSFYPSLLMMRIIYGYWGATTILLFWAAMIKATRTWGGLDGQGRAFGFLDGGRGLVTVGIGSLGVLLFSFLMIENIEEATLGQRQGAFNYVILGFSFLVVVISLLVWKYLKMEGDKNSSINNNENIWALSNIKTVLKIPTVWLLMLIILCAYVGYKITDDFSLYAKEVMLYDEIKAAQTGTLLMYARPTVGILIGFMADRSRVSVWMIVGFMLMLLGGLIFGSGIVAPGMVSFFFISLFATSIGIYSLRSLYFAAMQEGHIPLAVTGTAVGLISLVGYTPDIFVGPTMGYLLDSSPGELGHQHVFLMLAGFSALGTIASIVFYRLVKK